MGVYQANVDEIMPCVPENVILREILIILFLKTESSRTKGLRFLYDIFHQKTRKITA